MHPEFCDLYPRFLQTTETVPSRNRLNRRHRAIISWNCELLFNQRVLDVGSHDGRWSFAALAAGACHVIGIEARPHLIEKARANFSFYGIAPKSYRLIARDALKGMRALNDDSIDVLMCLGFFYHTMEHMAILLEARRLGANWIILDTGVVSDDAALIKLIYESVDDTRCSIDYAQSGRRNALVGIPSKSGLFAMLDYAGYEAELYDWHAGLAEDWADVADYRDRTRLTLRARRRRR